MDEGDEEEMRFAACSASVANALHSERARVSDSCDPCDARSNQLSRFGNTEESSRPDLIR